MKSHHSALHQAITVETPNMRTSLLISAVVAALIGRSLSTVASQRRDRCESGRGPCARSIERLLQEGPTPRNTL